jgi:hypothetical protein
MQAATTKVTIMATTMEVTNTPFRQSMSSGTGKELSYGLYNRNGRCRWNSSRADSLPSQDHDVAIETPILVLDFITTLDCTLTGSPPDARHSAVQATDSVSRSREEITVETPSPRMLTPYKASAISIVRFW